jgi:hypothetical protein
VRATAIRRNTTEVVTTTSEWTTNGTVINADRCMCTRKYKLLWYGCNYSTSMCDSGYAREGSCVNQTLTITVTPVNDTQFLNDDTVAHFNGRRLMERN